LPSTIDHQREVVGNHLSIGVLESEKLLTVGCLDCCLDVDHTVAEVATHSMPADCWTIVNGEVYNVTSWISKHPGGSQAIINLCGKDGSAAFNMKHGGQENPAKALASFKIGSLKNK